MTFKTVIPACLMVLAMVATPADAGNGKNKHAKKQGGFVAAGCPPGLAKKNPPCVPPGQAKSANRDYIPRYGIGDVILRDYRVIRDADRYGLRQGNLYYLAGQEVFRISPETGRVLAFVGLANALLN